MLKPIRRSYATHRGFPITLIGRDYDVSARVYLNLRDKARGLKPSYAR